MVAMTVSIDRAGRVVIPKELRERLALTSSSELEVTIEGDALLLRPARRRGRRVVEADGLLVLERVPGVSVTDSDIQRWRDDLQR